jgi:AraC family transcriptional regulator
MDKNASPTADKSPQTLPEAHFTTFIQLDGRSSVSIAVSDSGEFYDHSASVAGGASGPNHKAIVRPRSTSIVHPFRSNVIDFDSQPRCWAGSAFDYVHYSVPRKGLADIAEDLGFCLVNDYRLAVLEDDLVVAQITKSILPFLGRSDGSSVLALDQFSLVLGAHLLQRYGVLQKTAPGSKGGLAPWQKRRASELLHENMHGRIRLSEISRECGLSISHFARSFKTSFGVSTHQWLIQHRIDHAKRLLSQTTRSLTDTAIQSGFNDQAAFTRTFHQLVGVSPGRWRRHYVTKGT